MKEFCESGQGTRRRGVGIGAARCRDGRCGALPRRVRSMHGKGEQQFVFNQVDQRQGVALDVDRFPTPVSRCGLSFGAHDEHIERGVEIDLEGLEAALADQSDRNLQAAADAGPPHRVSTEIQVHANRIRRTLHHLRKAIEPAGREGAAQASFPRGEQVRIAESGQHKRLMLLRSKTWCQSEDATRYRAEPIHCGPHRKLEIGRMDIVLASSSPYRRELLSRLGLRFDTVSPGIDERPMDDESPRAMVARLACLKARAVAPLRPRALIVGSDQVAVLDNRIMGKPGSHEANVRQLRLAGGRQVRFLTGVALLNAGSGEMQCEVVEYGVHFRPLDETQVEAYVRAEKPYDCAGGFRAEGLGVALFQGMEGEDPSALIGLPLIALVSMLRREGIDPLLEACRR